MAIDVQGRILVGESAGSDADERPYVARRLATGAADPTFAGSDGIRTLTALVEQEVTSLVVDLLQSDGKIVAVGSIHADLTPVEGFLLVRLLTNGALDPSFDDDGKKRIEFDLDPNGRDVALAATLMAG